MKHLKTFENYSMFESKGAQTPTKAQVQKEIESEVKSKLNKLDKEELEKLIKSLEDVKGKINENFIFESKGVGKKTFMEKLKNALMTAGVAGTVANTVWGAIEMAKAVGPDGAENIGNPGMVPAALAGIGISALIAVASNLLKDKKKLG